MIPRTITLKEAMEICCEHKIVDFGGSKNLTGSTLFDDPEWVLLNNGWKIELNVEINGPYSEHTPDVDVEVKFLLYENE